ncbi:Peptidyl-prolyl cis-trans isomerase FKBP43 [Striga hermonthica]|uniref:peptidylprolyl isomerase n=1 Tax=Striga hermonthica TaxID=68872 RepID=A0A9N7MKB1_STRHE|nr:Peptidyl-prolyl cis-trans isomerase FKBP43 [Striga hermonthica]
MAFWGVELKPGKPITHYCKKARGRLRISQATLGIGDATISSTVQCNIGTRSPVMLCVLMPGKTEAFHLDLEFEEADDVVFSVIGPRSVYLTGYYLQKIQSVCLHNELSGKSQKPERKRKRHLKKISKIKKRSKKEEKTHTIQADEDNNTVLGEDNVHEMRKSELELEGISDYQCDLQHVENQTQEQPGFEEEIHTEEICEEHHEIPKQGNLVEVLPHGDNSKDDLQKEMGEIQIDDIIETDHQKQTILNGGLIIEELDSGPHDAKVASLGKKVKIYYTAMVKDTGHVFDSNVGKDALCFRLGDEAFIDSWNVGIDGMRIGGKRRLIVPPSMGPGDSALGEDVPPNSWLIYDIELLSVRR